MREKIPLDSRARRQLGDGHDSHADTRTSALGLGLGPRRIYAGRVCWRCSGSSGLRIRVLPSLFVWVPSLLYGYPAYSYGYAYPAYSYGYAYPRYAYGGYYRGYRPYYRPALYGGYRVARRVAIHRARWR